MTTTRFLGSILIAASMLFTAGCASTSTQESTGEYLDDTAITAKVKAAILNEPSLKVAQVNVETYRSVVQLSGFVSTRDEISKAGLLARAVPGVASVRNDLRLR